MAGLPLQQHAIAASFPTTVMALRIVVQMHVHQSTLLGSGIQATAPKHLRAKRTIIPEGMADKKFQGLLCTSKACLLNAQCATKTENSFRPQNSSWLLILV